VEEAIQQSETTRARLKIAEALFNDRLSRHLLQADRGKIRDRLNKASRERNRVIHGEWRHADDYSDRLLLLDRRTGSIQLWSDKDFKDVRQRFSRLEFDLMLFADAVVTAMKAGTVDRRETAQRPDNPEQIWVQKGNELRVVPNPTIARSNRF
jgi:hypothetical protein